MHNHTSIHVHYPESKSIGTGEQTSGCWRAGRKACWSDCLLDAGFPAGGDGNGTRLGAAQHCECTDHS